MDGTFGIVVDMKVCDGYIEYCRFSLDMGKEAAQDTFEQLLGLPDYGSDLPLRISLVRLDDFPYEILQVKHCRLDELTWNCGLITREIFKFYNLES